MSADITSVQVGGYQVQDWVYHDPIYSFATSDITDCHRHPELKRKLYSAYAESDEGELAIPIPRQVAVKSSGHYGGGIGTSEGTDVCSAVNPIHLNRTSI